jgi:lauroyl/myristoyl acyltransferase
MSKELEQKHQDIEQLCYFGMRAAFGRQHTRRLLRRRAEACIRRRLRTEREWISGDPFPTMRTEGEQFLRAVLKASQGAIICAPHVGPYHRIPLELVKRDLRVSLLLDAANFEREQRLYSDRARLYAGRTPDPMHYINAEIPSASWEMACALRSGRVLLVYMDGNTGLKCAEPAKTLVEVDFCGLRIDVRKGPGYLSAFAGVPIIPLVARFTNRGGHAMRFEPQLEKKPNQSVDDYCRNALQLLFSILERYVKTDPSCWEEWCNIHLWIVRDRHGSSSQPLTSNWEPEDVLQLRLVVNEENVDFLRMSTGDIVASLQSEKALLLTAPVLDLLSAFDGRHTVANVLDRLSGSYDETLLLQTLYSLCAGGFLSAADSGNPRKTRTGRV